MQKTSATLLERLRQPGADEAWEAFYRIYSPVILRYARQRGMDAARAEDVLQETMVILLRVMPGFKYDTRIGLFRNFLLNIVHQRILAAKRRKFASMEIPMESAASLEARREHTARDEAMPGDGLDRLWVQRLQELAWERIAGDNAMDASTLEVYRAYVQREMPADQVAKRFRIKANAVYQIKNRVDKRMAMEIKRLCDELGEGAPSP